MSLLKRVLYQIRKFNLRHVGLPPVDNIIFSENASEHWSFLRVEHMNVLDLGIGRLGKIKIEETTPVHFMIKNAKKIIGVDTNKDEVDFFTNYFNENYRGRSIFIHKFIKNSQDLFSLISEHNISAIKCDIEGAEVNLFKLKLQDFHSLQHIAIEYHSPLILKQLIKVNNLEWNFKVINHSIFPEYFNMGVVTLSR
jgi:hypothetical protein